MIRIFAGYDRREAGGFHVFVESLILNASEPVSITPLHGFQGDGSNSFTYSRFLVPYLCDFKGTAIFLDGADMLMRTDIAELARLTNCQFAVQVVKHDYHTKHPVKYIGTEMQAPNPDYPRKQWSSVTIWNCEHPKNQWLTPERVRSFSGAFLHRFAWLMDSEIGELPASMNVLIGEQEHPDPKIVHYTLGIPAIPQYEAMPYSEEWRTLRAQAAAIPTLLETV